MTDNAFILKPQDLLLLSEQKQCLFPLHFGVIFTHARRAVEFEFDAAKSHANAQKHGIDFLRARGLWLDEMRLEIPARTEDEARWLLVAKLDGKHWAAIYSRRAGRIRIISVRRARREERAWYEGENA